MPNTTSDSTPACDQLLAAIKKDHAVLSVILERASSHWYAEGKFYRFYHQSFKVYALQPLTDEIVAALRKLSKRELNLLFLEIVEEETGIQFTSEHNARWQATTRPILEAFFHARTFLEFAVRYGAELDSAPNPLPSGWAALLKLYQIR